MVRVFLSTWGQSDNIGDSILRRGLLRTFHGIDDAQLHVHVGRRERDANDEGYLSAVGLNGDEVEHDHMAGWLGRYTTSAMRRRTVYVMPAGEMFFPERTRFYWGWWTALLAAMPLMRGGSTVQVGAGVRMSAVGKASARRSRGARDVVHIPKLERYARTKMPVVGWRDPATQDSFQIGDVVPDWAFGEGPDPQFDGLGAPPRERTLMAVTTRWDRGVLSSEKIRMLRDIADSRGLRIQVYSQVRRDRELMEELARELHPGTAPILFGDQSHAEWETQVRALHRESAIVASDRLHALIIGTTEGAVPLAISNSTTEKVSRTLKPGGFVLPPENPEAINTYLDEMFADDASVSRRIATARAKLDAVRGTLRAAVADCAAPNLRSASRSRLVRRRTVRGAQRPVPARNAAGPLAS